MLRHWCKLAELGLVLLLVACQSPAADTSPTGSASTRAAGSASARAAPQDSRVEPKPGETLVKACPAASADLFLRIIGDGAPQTLRAGAARPPRSIRNCEPASVGDEPTVSACDQASAMRRSCFYATAKNAAYFDRGGDFFQLDVRRWVVKRQAGRVTGEISATGRTQNGKKLELTVEVQVRAGGSAVAVPGLWQDGAPWVDL
jgi:hypothetical protein